MARTNYRQMSEQKPVEEPTVVETEVNEVVEAPVEEPKVVVTGVVSDCLRLNVRAEAKPDAEIVCTIDCDTEVIIDEDGSTDEFYKVCTAAGVEGFCMRKYITKQ